MPSGGESGQPRLCGARTRSGGTCQQVPREGEKRCWRHGAGRPDRPGGRPVEHGHSRSAVRLRRLNEVAGARLLELLHDPGTIDATLAAAVARLGVENLALEPSEEVIEAVTRVRARDILKREPDEETLERMKTAVREELTQGQAIQVIEAARHLARVQDVAYRQKTTADLILRGAYPIVEGYGRKVSELVARYLPAGQRAAFARDLATLNATTLAELTRLGEEKAGR